MVRLTSDVSALKMLTQVSLRIGTRAPLLMLGSLILMFSTSQSLALTMLPLLLVTSVIIVFFISIMEPLFRSVLTAKPDSLDAVLGIAAVQVKRGGDDLAKAEASLNGIIEKDPRQARARFLLGQVFERRADASRAMIEYKKAAELALDR